MVVVFIILVVLLIFGLTRMGRRGWGWGGGCCSTSDGGRGGTDALDIARERYARGEISEEEFNRIKRGLS